MKIQSFRPIDRAIYIFDFEISDRELATINISIEQIDNIRKAKSSMQLDFLSMLARRLEEINEMGKTS